MFEWFNTDITAKEIETSIRKLKTNESPGNDQLINGYFMNSATYLSRTNEPLKNAIPRHIPTSVVQINCINPNSQKRKQHSKIGFNWLFSSHLDDIYKNYTYMCERNTLSIVINYRGKYPWFLIVRYHSLSKCRKGGGVHF